MANPKPPKPSRDDICGAVDYTTEIVDRLHGDAINSLLIAVMSLRGPDKVLHCDELSEEDADWLLKLLIDVKNQNPEVWGSNPDGMHQRQQGMGAHPAVAIRQAPGVLYRAGSQVSLRPGQLQPQGATFNLV
jgi:hypothetical protein